MAGGMDLGTSVKGRKRPLDVAINLVPFIDLMAVMISFLIMTAVWNQIGRIPVSQEGGARADAPTEMIPLTLLITQSSVRLTIGNQVKEALPFVRDPNGKLDLGKLKAELKELKMVLPDMQAITLQTEDAVRYDDLVRIIDGCIGEGLLAVQVSPVSG